MVILDIGPLGLPVSVSVGPFIFYAYGLILGTAGILAWVLAQQAARAAGVRTTELQRYACAAILGGIVGARLWHLATDWKLYSNVSMEYLEVWRGGLSIFGGILGAFVGMLLLSVWLSRNKKNKFERYKYFFDIFALSIPAAQAFGRLANFINQELYGLPTTVWWGIAIDVEHRVAGYHAFSRFHPLFAYEALAMCLFAVWSWRQLRMGTMQIGRGVLVTWYIVYYATLRFLLDFLRIDVIRIFWEMTANQIVMVSGLLCFGAYLLMYHVNKTKTT